MGLADVFSHELSIAPGEDGSFVVYSGESGKRRGFTNAVDLITFLQRAAQAQQAAEVETLTHEQMLAKPGGSLEVPASTIGSLRRTTALGSLADRIAAAETPKGAA